MKLKWMLNRFIFSNVVFKTTKIFFIEKYTYQASALAYTTILALIPLFAVSVFIATIFPEFTNFISIFESYLFKYFVPSVASSLNFHFHNFIQQAVHLPLISIIFLIFTVLLMMNTIDETINDIWRITKKRKKIIGWLIYAVILLIAPILIGLSVFITSSIFSYYLFSKIATFLIIILPIIINTGILSLFYLFVPNTYVRKSDGILGGFVVALLIEISRTLFASYITHFSNYELIYGVFSILPIFLIWLYIFWFIILWGAVFTHTLSQKI